MSDRAGWLRRYFTNISTSGVVAAGDNLSVTPRSIVANRAKWTTYIQSIFLTVYTDNAATQQFQSITTDQPVAETAASPGVGARIEFNFGEEGYALPEGEGLELINSGAGLAYNYTVVGYQKPTATMQPSEL